MKKEIKNQINKIIEVSSRAYEVKVADTEDTILHG